MKRIDIAEKNLVRINQWIANSDGKIGYILAFQGGLLIFLTTKGEEIKSIVLSPSMGFFEWMLYLSLIFFCVFILKSIYHSFRTLRPDIRVRNQSLFFFGSIASMSKEYFKKQFQELTEEQILDELNDQTHINSTIANAKMKNIGSAIDFVFLASIPLLISLLLIPWLNQS